MDIVIPEMNLAIDWNRGINATMIILGDFISTQPSIPNRDLTEAQQEEFIRIREKFYSVGECFKYISSGVTNPFSEGILSVKNKKMEEMILHWADSYFKHWKLIWAGYKSIKIETQRLGCEFPFETPQDLFMNVVEAEANASVNDFLWPYKEVSIKKISEALDFYLKGLPALPPGSPPPRKMREMREIFRTNNIQGWAWDKFLVRVLAKSALQQPYCSNREKIEKYLSSCLQNQITLIEDYYFPGLRHRNEWEQVFFSRSYAWKKGRMCFWDQKTKGYTDCC